MLNESIQFSVLGLFGRRVLGHVFDRVLGGVRAIGRVFDTTYDRGVMRNGLGFRRRVFGRVFGRVFVTT